MAANEERHLACFEFCFDYPKNLLAIFPFQFDWSSGLPKMAKMPKIKKKKENEGTSTLLFLLMATLIVIAYDATSQTARKIP